MPHGIFQKIGGIEGTVTIPSLGALIGKMDKWSLTMRRDEEDSDGEGAVGLYDLRAVFSYFNPHLWEDKDYEKDIVVVLGKGPQRLQFRVQQANGEETVLTGRTLLMKGVSLDVVR